MDPRNCCHWVSTFTEFRFDTYCSIQISTTISCQRQQSQTNGYFVLVNIQFTNDDFEFDLNEYRLVYQQVDIDKLKLIHSTVYHDRKGRYWIDPNDELFDLRKTQWY